MARSVGGSKQETGKAGEVQEPEDEGPGVGLRGRTKRKLSCVLRSVRRGAKLEASGRGARWIASVERNRGAEPRLWGFNLSASLRCDVTGRLVPLPRQFSC